MKYIDVTRATHTTLDVRIDDCWNIYRRIKRFVWYLDSFYSICFMERKASRRIHVVGGSLTKRQATSRLDHLWPEIWKHLSKNSKQQEKNNLAIEKPKLDNARRLGGICFIDPQDIGFKEIIKNARRKLEVPTAPAMPCKKTNNRHGETRCIKYNRKSKFACILEASESTRFRVEGILPKNHEDHTTGKGSDSLHHYNLVHNFFLSLKQ